MHALLVTVEIEAGRGDEATEALHGIVVPEAKAAPGFVSGTWARSTDGTKGHGFMLFDSEEAARNGAAQASHGPPGSAPVRFVSADVLEVMAQA